MIGSSRESNPSRGSSNCTRCRFAICDNERMVQNLHLTVNKEIKSSVFSRYYIASCNEAHICGLTTGRCSFQKTMQWWRAVGDTMSRVWPVRESNHRAPAPIAMSSTITPIPGQLILMIIKNSFYREAEFSSPFFAMASELSPKRIVKRRQVKIL